jgi:rRNA biogenesis protein RRP5
MSSLKRKDAPGGTPATKSPKRSKSEKAQSKQKQDAQSSETTKTPSRPKHPSASGVSRLKEEEPLFPRGGASVLSPLEHKQISIQAKQDVLFEQESGEGAKKTDKALKRKKAKASKDKSSNGAESAEDVVKVESLNYQVSCFIERRCLEQHTLTGNSA